MRKHYLLYASAAMVALASCSREAKEVITPEMSTSYAKISISMASAPGTRADWGEFDSGSYDESKMALEDIHLVFYDDAGFVVGSGEHIATALDEGFSITATGTEFAGVSDDNAVVFKLDLYEGAPLPTKVAAFINVDPMAFNLDKISDIMTNVSDVYKTEKGYIMTSAGYYDAEGEYVIAAKLNSDGIFTTISQAADAGATKAADIYVERLAAKVKIDNDAEGVDQDNQKFIVKDKDGAELSVKFSETFNWGLTGTAKEMYMLKKPFGYETDDSEIDNSWMYDSDKCRSYWAEGANWEKGYDAYQPEEGEPLLNYLSYNGVVENGKPNGETDYALEHTYDYSVLKDAPLFNVNVPSTSAIVIGTYEIKKGDTPITFEDEGDNGFYLLYAGADNGKSVYTLYSRAELIDYLVNGKTIYDRDGEEVSDFSLAKVGTQFKLVAKECQVDPEDDNDKTYTTLYTDNEQKNEVAKTNARHYVGSMGYFFVPVKHHLASVKKHQVESDESGEDAVTEPVTGYYGVVRNHSYVLSITSIQGLAAPLDDKYTSEGDDVDPEDPNYPEGGDPDEPIIPDPDDLKEAYIQASIKVLSWHVVSQKVEL